MRNYSRERNETEHGMVPLLEAIDALYYDRNDKNRIAESLVICTGMIPEAIRFRHIEGLVRRSILPGEKYLTFRPDPLMYSVVEQWDTLSERIQKSTDGSFDPIQLGLPDNPFYWDNVGQAITRLSLMLFVCNTPPRTPLLIRSLGDHDGGPFCSKVETTVRIVGRDSLCVDVKDGDYTDGNAIQLFQCKDNLDANQLWTLKKDGTIQSNGKCLTVTGLIQTIVICNCTTAATDFIRWQVWQNGTIINPATELVLNAPSIIPGATLDAQRNTYAASQSWTVTNVMIRPRIQSIVGCNNSQCLETNGSDVWLADCAVKGEQDWALEADGTIRPQQDGTSCLGCDGDYCVLGAKLIIIDCGGGYPTTRWYFENDGSIVNPGSRLVIEVVPSLNQIIVNATQLGNPNQEWFLMP